MTGEREKGKWSNREEDAEEKEKKKNKRTVREHCGNSFSISIKTSLGKT